MVVLDLFSAASKPMPDWDAIPRRPLQFAATLHPIDPNSLLPVALPRPKRDRQDTGIPTAYPESVFRPVRHGSLSGSRLAYRGSDEPVIGSDEWMQRKVQTCVDTAKGDLNISGYDLEALSPKIADLGNLVTFSNVRSPVSSPSLRQSRPSDSSFQQWPARRVVSEEQRSFMRTRSAPASAAFFDDLRISERPSSSLQRTQLLPSPSLVETPNVSSNQAVENRVTGSRPPATARVLDRSKTGAIHLKRRGYEETRSSPHITIIASSNRLTSLPTALFEIRYLTVLSLRSNKLTSLPAAIGELVHLRELNISNNHIKYLPSTILNLESLDVFNAHPNLWLPRPERDSETSTTVKPISGSQRILGPLQTFEESGVPRLTTLCINVLLTPRPPSNLPPFVDCYAWDECRENSVHPLLSPSVLEKHIMGIDGEDLPRVLQAVKSACNAQAQRTKHTNMFPPSPQVAPDDASTNPYYYPCPSPNHKERRIFLDVAEERIEWREIANTQGLPVKWQGCSPGCLSFLDGDSDIEGAAEDGFSLEELEGYE